MKEEQLTNRQALGIGTICGVALILIIFIFISLISILQYGFSLYLDSFNDGSIIYIVIASIALSYPGVPAGIIGALIGKSRKNTRKATWIGGILGAILGAVFCTSITLLLSAL